MNNIYILLSVCLCLFSSCIPEPVEIDIDQAEPRLVITSQMLSDEAAIIQITRSFGALEFSESAGDTVGEELLEQIVVDSARVTISYDGGIDTLLGLGGGAYLALGTPFNERAFYQLMVYDSATGLQASAETEVLPRAVWDSLDYEFVFESVTLLGSTFEDTLLRAYIAFEDASEENYYMLNSYRLSTLEENQANSFLLGQTGPPTQIYSDQLFGNASILRDTIDYSGFAAGDTVAFAISQISRGYYDYLSTRQRSGSSFFANLLQEPVNFPSNVEGGYGFFNLHLPSAQVRILE